MGTVTANGITLVGSSIKTAFVNLPPSWITGGGSLGNVYDFETITSGGFIVQAFDPDGLPVPVMYDIIADPDGFVLAGGVLNSSTGVITGPAIPVASDTVYNFTVRASDGDIDITRAFSITVLDNVAPVWTTPSGTLGSRHESETITSGGFQVTAIDIDGGPGTIVYSVQSGSLPTGASLNTSTGAITGPAVSVGSNTTYNFTIRASDTEKFTDRAFSITVDNNAAPVWQTSNASPITTVNNGDSVNVNVNATDADSLPMALTYTVVAGALPDGLSLNSSTGDITGTVTITGSSLFTIEASDGLDTAQRQFEIVVNQISSTVGNSLLFRNRHLSWTPASAGDRRTWSWSGWVKRGTISDDEQSLFGAQTSDDAIRFNTNDTIDIYFNGTSQGHLRTAAVYRDPASWYHIVVAVDTTQAVAADRVNLYINGGQVTDFTISSYPSLNYEGVINNNGNHEMGREPGNNDVQNLDGYMAEINFVDGQQLTASDFGFLDDDNGWQPIDTSGLIFGTNGFRLQFSDNTNVTTLGEDSSGNTNDWTLVGFSVSQQTLDTPTVNYAVLNYVDESTNSTMVSGNTLYFNTSGSGNKAFKPVTIPVKDGKYYYEITVSNGAFGGIGFTTSMGIITGDEITGNNSRILGEGSTEYAWRFDGNKINNGSTAALGAAVNANDDIVICAVDVDNGKIWFGKNGSWFSGDPAAGTGEHWSWTPGQNVWLCVGSQHGGGGTYVNTANFGQFGFAYTPPTGFVSLNTDNISTPVIADPKLHFNPAIYNGDGTLTHDIVVGFQPDLVWMKNRNAIVNHALYDSSHTLMLQPNVSDAEVAGSAIMVYNTDGFRPSSSDSRVNANSNAYVAWNWMANGSGVANTDGSITSTVSSNTTSGFSIVSYTGTGANTTVGHGLGITPNMIIFKNRSIVENWPVYHSSIPATNVVFLNLTNASTVSSLPFNNTAPTSSVISLGTAAYTNGNANSIVAYCFAEVDGFSKFGSYTGNGSINGPFVYCGFRPAYVLVKRTNTTGNWYIFDTTRSLYNVIDDVLSPDTSGAENISVNNNYDLVSNGFKPRNSSGVFNASGGTYIYAAFAEYPFKTARAR